MSIISLSSNNIKIKPYNGAFLSEIIHFEKNQEIKLLGRVVSLSLDCVTVQPLGNIPSINLSELRTQPTQKPIQVNMSPTIIGRKFNSVGNPLDGLGEILEIETGDLISVEKVLAYSKIENISQSELYENLAYLTQDNLVLVIVGQANLIRDRILQSHFLTQISVQYEVGNLWTDWIIAFEQAAIVAHYIASVLNFEVIIILDGDQQYKDSISRQNQFYTKFLTDLPVEITYPDIVSSGDVDSKIQLWLV